jgi:hypothetical protein
LRAGFDAAAVDKGGVVVESDMVVRNNFTVAGGGVTRRG